MSLDPVALVVLGWTGAQASAGAGKYLQDRVYQRLASTFGKAESKKKHDPIDASDRVKAKVFGEAAFTDDEITLEYLAGVLAASGPNDDAGAAIVAQIGRLSADHLLLHYIVYRELRRLWPPHAPLNLYQQAEAKQAGIRIYVDELLGPIQPNRLGNIIGTLVRESLLDDHYEATKESLDGVQAFTARVRPTALGAELFLWGHGVNDTHASHLVDGTALELLPDLPSTPSTSLLTPPTPPDSP